MERIVYIFLVLALASCRGLNSKTEEASSPSDDLEFVVDSLPETRDIESSHPEEAPQEVQEEKIALTEETPVMTPPDEPKIEDFLSSKKKSYRATKDDTFMMVAFKIYGDYRRWKEIRAWNKDVKKITEGVELFYEEPLEVFNWAPEGTPYLVRRKDTLQIISMDKYGTTKKWKRLFEHNQPLIRDPNLIFAGFTIYYPKERDLASGAK